MIKKITQSFIKSMKAYLAGEECGNITKAQWVDDRLIDLDSESADLGAYFEYYFTLIKTGVGSLPKNGKVPVRGVYKTDANKPLAKYATAEANAMRLIEYFDKMGLKIIGAGKKLTKGRFEGTVDLIVECQKPFIFEKEHDWVIEWKAGDKLVIDLKYSGLLDDKWSKHGWMWSDTQKEYHGIQAKHYHLISGLPFYFLILSSTNEDDVKMFHIPVMEEMVKEHTAMANKLFSDFELEVGMGFLPRPEVSRCRQCPLNAECKDKYEYPHPEMIFL